MSESLILVITGTPPGDVGVGEVYLRDLIKGYGANKFNCAAIVPEYYEWNPSQCLSGMRCDLIRSKELFAKPWGHGRMGAIGSYVNNRASYFRTGARIAENIFERFNFNNIGRVLVVFNRPIIAAIAYHLAKKCDSPLYGLIWDHPAFVSRHFGFDRFSKQIHLDCFLHVISEVKSLAVVSEQMKEVFSAQTEAKLHIVRYGATPDYYAYNSTNEYEKCNEWVIGFAGTLLATCAFSALISALDKAEWLIAGKRARLKIWTKSIHLVGSRHTNIEYKGYPSQNDTQEEMKDCHLTYLPHPFMEEYTDFTMYSFPTKLTSYLSLGRPVFLHCTSSSAVAKFFADNPFGVMCNELGSEAILKKLESVFETRNYFSHMDAARRVASNYLSSRAFLSAVRSFLE